jgi:hypothetical protein
MMCLASSPFFPGHHLANLNKIRCAGSNTPKQASTERTCYSVQADKPAVCMMMEPPALKLYCLKLPFADPGTATSNHDGPVLLPTAYHKVRAGVLYALTLPPCHPKAVHHGIATNAPADNSLPTTHISRRVMTKEQHAAHPACKPTVHDACTHVHAVATYSHAVRATHVCTFHHHQLHKCPAPYVLC